MLRSLYSGVSGLGVNQKSMDVIGNNIANVNTIGYKESRAVFQDLMSQTLVGGKTPTDARGGINPRQVGSGAYLAAVDNIFEPGILKSTNRTADLGIEGEGLFVVRGEGALQRYYTRAGDFNFDRSGTLTNPSGYKVQGWMSDPATGEINSDATIGDIILGPEYQIMQSKASSEVNLAGTLDTRATASKLTYNKFLTQAAAQQSLTNLTNKSGVGLDLTKGEPVRIKAHASTKTLMSEIVAKNEAAIGMKDGDQVTFTFRNTPYTIKYSASSGKDRSDDKFHTVDDFIEEVNNIFKKVGAGDPVASMSLQNGTFVVSGNSSFELTSVSGNSTLSTIMSSITGAYGSGINKTSGDMFYVKEVKAMEDFSNLSELGLQVENAINGNVVQDGFGVEFLTNNFGMKEGESFTIDNILVGNDATGAIPAATPMNIGPFIYTEEENPIAGNKFHTVQELADKMASAINTNAALVPGITNPPQVNFGVIGGKITLSHKPGSGNIEMGTTSMHKATGGGIPNPYLKTVLDGSYTTVDATGIAKGRIMNDFVTTLEAGEISGKGRLVYNYSKTNNNLKLNMATREMQMAAGDTLSFTIGGTKHTITYDPTIPPAVGSFNDGQTLEDAIANLAIPGFVANWDATGGADNTGTLDFTGTVTIDDVSTTSTTPYLKNLLSSQLKNKTLTAVPTSVNGQVPEVTTITGLSIDKAYSGTIFESNVLSSNSIGVNKSITSEQFLTQADENAKLLDLFSGNGESFNFTENETTLNFAGSIGGEKLTNNGVFTVKVGNTLADMANAMEEYLGLGKDHNARENVLIKNGCLIINGEKGLSNNIDFMNITGPSSKYGVFNQYMTYETKGATGGRLATNMDIYDEQGNAHVVNFKFSLWNEEQNEWRIQIEPDDPEASIAINGATSNELVIKFNSDGSMAYMYDRFPDPATIMVNPTLRFSAPNGTNSISDIKLNIGTQGGTDGMVLAAATNTFTQNSSDGYPQGNLESKLFNPAGELVGTYTNGQVRTLAQIGLATFVNQQGLMKVGDSMFAATGNSGQATVGKAQTGSRGDISSGMLENSNVDLSMELVDMITTQRGFQANSKIISTSDEMIQELLNMKR